jgi:DNA-binding response OmpR family regulator/Tfp pilus assembly protein PilZ
MLFDRLGPTWEAFQAEARASIRILVVDDEPSVCLLLSELLSSQGFTVEAAATVAEATEALHSGDHALIVLDKNLPDGSGIDLLRSLRAAGNEVPVVIITGYPSAETLVDALTMGAADYLSKPFDDLDHVSSRLGSVIDARIARHLNDRMVRDLAEVLEAEGADRVRVARIADRLFAHKRELAARASVLVVEDNPAVAEVIRRTLESVRLRTEWATDLGAARDWLARLDGPLTALVSVDLPEALETVASLRAQDPLLEVVVTTGSTEVDLALGAVSAGATDYVVRTFEGIDVLRGRMQRAVGRARRRRLYLHLIATLYREAKGSGSSALDHLARVAGAGTSGGRDDHAEPALAFEEVDLADMFDSESELEVELEVIEAAAPTVTVRRTAEDTETDDRSLEDHDRRRFRRMEANLEVRFQAVTDARQVGEIVYSHLKDLSAGGMFILMDDPLPLGARISVALDLGWGMDPIEVVGEVVRRVTRGRMGSERSGIGVRFLDPNDPALQRLVDGLAQRVVPA